MSHVIFRDPSSLSILVIAIASFISIDLLRRTWDDVKHVGVIDSAMLLPKRLIYLRIICSLNKNHFRPEARERKSVSH